MIKIKIKQLILEQIEYLSKSQNKVAQYVLEYPGNVAIHSAQEVGAAIGVSETTVIRFCHSLGLTGYAALQKEMRTQLYVKESSLKTYQSSKLAYEKEDELYKKVMGQDRKIIEETMNRIDATHYGEAVQQIANAKKIYVLGVRSSFAAANWLSYTLNLVRENVHCMRPQSEDIIQTLNDMDEESVLIVISFHRYMKETVQMAKLATKKNCFVIGLSDSRLAPIYPYCNLLFPIYAPEKSTIDATTSLFSLMNAFIAGVSIQQPEKFEKRQQLYEQIESDFLFIEGIEKE